MVAIPSKNRGVFLHINHKWSVKLHEIVAIPSKNRGVFLLDVNGHITVDPDTLESQSPQKIGVFSYRNITFTS